MTFSKTLESEREHLVVGKRQDEEDEQWKTIEDEREIDWLSLEEDDDDKNEWDDDPWDDTEIDDDEDEWDEDPWDEDFEPDYGKHINRKRLRG